MGNIKGRLDVKKLNELLCENLSILYLTIIISLLEFTLLKKVTFIGLLISILIIIVNIIGFNRDTIVFGGFKLFLGILFLYFFILVLYLYAFPLFPLIFSQDFIVHLSNALDLVNGKYQFSSLAYNPAIGLFSANFIFLAYANGNILLTMRLVMLFVLWSAIPYVYTIGTYLGNEKFGFVTSIAYMTLNPFFYSTLVQTGLYANALGLTIALSTIYLFIETNIKPSNLKYILLACQSLILLLSHSTNIILLPTFLLTVLYLRFVENKNNSFKPLFSVFLAPVIILFIKPEVIFRLPSALESPFTLVQIGGDFISESLSVFPLLRQIYLELPLGLIMFVLTFTISLYLLFRKKLYLFSIFFFWLLIIVCLSFFSTNVWRFALLAFTPMCLLSGLVYQKIILYFYYYKIKNSFSKYISIKLLKYFGVSIIIIILVLYGAVQPYSIILTSTWSREQQYGFYECLVWFKTNSEPDSIVISIGGHPLFFLPYIANRTFLGRFPGEKPEFAYDLLKNYSNGYVVVWNRLHPYNDSFYYVDLYKNSSLFREVWANHEVTVFKLVK
jgi:hypothetical protein